MSSGGRFYLPVQIHIQESSTEFRLNLKPSVTVTLSSWYTAVLCYSSRLLPQSIRDGLSSISSHKSIKPVYYSTWCNSISFIEFSDIVTWLIRRASGL